MRCGRGSFRSKMSRDGSPSLGRFSTSPLIALQGCVPGRDVRGCRRSGKTFLLGGRGVHYPERDCIT